MGDGWAIFYGRGLKCFSFDLARALQLARDLHGVLREMRYVMNLREQLIGFEGLEHEAYPDPLTHGDPWTIGVGHTGPEVHQGLIWTDEQINKALDEDIAHAIKSCTEHFSWFEQLNEARQAVVIGMVFQLGINGVLKFEHTLSHMEAGDWDAAADGMRQSLWAKQTHDRAYALASQMESGEFA